MNKVQRRKLGLAQSDAKVEAAKILEKIDEISPISQTVQSKDYTNASKNIKVINIGTLRNPIEKLAVYDESIEAYVPIEATVKVANNTTPIYYSEADYNVTLNGEVGNYSTNQKIDQNNPFDPLFGSFNRLYSLPAQTYVESGVTGVRFGEKEKFFLITSGFDKSTIIVVTGAGTNLNGSFAPSTQIIQGKTRYINASLAFPASISWSNSPSGWVLSQTTVPGSLTVSLSNIPRYFLSSTGNIPTGSNWVRTGLRGISGVLPVPSASQKEYEGFFKLSTTRKSQGKDFIFATPVGITGATTGATSGSLPLGASWVTYPHSYNVESYPAFRYPVSLTFAEDGTGITDLLVVSTGIQDKKIIYVSPHSIQQFQGFWSQSAPSNRQQISGNSSDRPIFVLKSGNLVGLTSETLSYTGLSSIYLTGQSGINSSELWNFENARLKQSVPLSQTLFYKLYEPVYLKNELKTGTWDGIIPSGVPFSIETVRSKNAEIYSPKITVHVHETFVNMSPSGSGQFQYVRPFNYEDLAGFGSFDGYKQAGNLKSKASAQYEVTSKAKRQAKSKLRGYLWERGLTVDNAKVKKVAKLFGNRVTPSGIIPKAGSPRYCLTYINPSDPRSCSYTGVERGVIGISTSAGIRLLDTNSTLIRNIFDEDGNLIKFLPIEE